MDSLTSINAISKTDSSTPLGVNSTDEIKPNPIKIAVSIPTATTSIMSCDTSTSIISAPLPNYEISCGNEVANGGTSLPTANYASVYAAAVGHNGSGYGGESNPDLINNTNNGGYGWSTTNLQQHSNCHSYQNSIMSK